MRNYIDDMEDELDPVDWESEMEKPVPMDVDIGDDSTFAYAEPEAQPMNLKVKDYMEKYSQANRQKLLDENANPGFDWRSRLAALGAGIGGRDPFAALSASKQSQQAERDKKLSDFDTGRNAAVADRKYTGEQDLLARESDPNSVESQSAQQLALKMGVNKDIVKNLTAAKFKSISPAYTKMYEIDQRAKDREESRKSREAMLEATLGRKREEAEKPSDKQVDAFVDFDTAKSDLGSMLSGLGNNSNWVGPVDGRIADALVGDDQVAWRSSVGKFKDAYRKAVTGAGASIAEIGRLESRLPSENDTIANFKAKANEAIKDLERRKKVYSENLTKGGKNVSKFADPEKSGGYPKTVRKGTQSATVSSPEEEKEAMAEGFQ